MVAGRACLAAQCVHGAIDEAHCIHEWLVYGCHIHHVNYNYALSRGESFRKSFQEIGLSVI